MMRLVGAALCFALAILASAGMAQDQSAPRTGPLNDRVYVPALDGVCALGTTLGDGCERIKSREIVDAAQKPWSAIGRLNFASTRIRSHCTGTLIGESTVLTAAHCLYNSTDKAWIPPASIQFVAGYQRGVAVATAHATGYVLPAVHDTGTRNFGDGIANDWALVTLDAPVGRVAGTILLADTDLAEVEDTFLAGYPGLRPHVLSVAHDCRTWRANTEGTLGYATCATMQGDSGAPLLVARDGQLAVVGVHNFIVVDYEHRLFTATVPAWVFRSRPHP